jgi:hypothetical protein
MHVFVPFLIVTSLFPAYILSLKGDVCLVEDHECWDDPELQWHVSDYSSIEIAIPTGDWTLDYDEAEIRSTRYAPIDKGSAIGLHYIQNFLDPEVFMSLSCHSNATRLFSPGPLVYGADC